MKLIRIAAAMAAACLTTLSLSTPSYAGDYGYGTILGNGRFEICRQRDSSDCALFQATDEDTACYYDDMSLGAFLHRMRRMDDGFYYHSYRCGPGNNVAGIVQICIGYEEGSHDNCLAAIWVQE